LKKNLVLTGMMGVGKSTLGKTLSERLNMKFIDIDNLIEKRESMSISDIFDIKGEKYFREIEKKVTLKSIYTANNIIALGGGAFMNTAIRNLVLKNCTCFWLDLDLNVLSKRLIKSNKRPLLKKENLEIDLKKIYNKRKLVYKLAHFKINCKKLSKTLISKKISQLYES
jgi:shikimate kinase